MYTKVVGTSSIQPNTVNALQGDNDIDQLCRVLHVLGTPSEEIWPVSGIKILTHMLLIT